MSRRCMVTDKKVVFGNNRSHAENKTRRTFLPNLRDASVYSEALKRWVSLRVSAAGLRTIDHNGGIDSYVMSIAKTKLVPALRLVRTQVEKALAAQK